MSNGTTKKESLLTRLGHKVDKFGEDHPKIVRFTRTLGETALTFGKFTAKVLTGAAIVVVAASRFVESSSTTKQLADPDNLGLIDANNDDATNTTDI